MKALNRQRKESLSPKAARAQKLSRKILLPVLGIFVLSFLGFLIFSYLTTSSDAKAKETENSKLVEQFFQSRIQTITDFANGLAIQTATNPNVQAMFAAQDRQALMDLTLETFLSLKDGYQIRQFQFNLPPATTFLRLHKPESFGDDLSSFRFAVLEANTLQHPVGGLEVGRNGVGIRGIQPVFYEERFIGSVEFGLNFDEAFVADLKENFGNDWRILLTKDALSRAKLEDFSLFEEGPTPETLILASTIEEAYPDLTIYNRVLNGERLINQVSSEGRVYSVTSLPLRDYSSKIIGVVEIIIDQTAVIQAQNTRIVFLILGISLALLFGAYVVTTFTNRALQPLEELTRAARSIEKGDLEQKVNIAGLDEIGLMGNAFNAMVSQLRDLISTQEQRIAQRTRAIETSAIVGRRLSTVLDTEELVKAVATELQDSFGYYHVQIYLLEKTGNSENGDDIPSEGVLRLAGGTGSAGAEMIARRHQIPWGKGLVGRAAASGTVVFVSDTRSDPDWLPNSLLPETTAELAVPILIGDEVLGALDVQHNIQGGLSQQDVDLLQIIASQVAVTLQNSRSYTAARQQTEHEILMGTIIEQIQQTTSIEQALKVTAREIGRAVGQRPAIVSLSSVEKQSIPSDES